MRTLPRAVTLAVATAALTGAVLFSAPSTLQAEVLERPNTPMAAIIEINHDYVRVQGLNVYNPEGHTKTLSDHIIESTAGLDTVYFDVNNRDHLQQVIDLSDFGCRLYNRRAVFAGEFHGGEVHGPIYLFACAIP